MRDVDSWRAQEAEELFVADNPHGAAAALAVDATRRATTAYLGSNDPTEATVYDSRQGLLGWRSC